MPRLTVLFLSLLLPLLTHATKIHEAVDPANVPEAPERLDPEICELALSKPFLAESESRIATQIHDLVARYGEIDIVVKWDKDSLRLTGEVARAGKRLNGFPVIVPEAEEDRKRDLWLNFFTFGKNGDQISKSTGVVRLVLQPRELDGALNANVVVSRVAGSHNDTGLTALEAYIAVALAPYARYLVIETMINPNHVEDPAAAGRVNQAFTQISLLKRRTQFSDRRIYETVEMPTLQRLVSEIKLPLERVRIFTATGEMPFPTHADEGSIFIEHYFKIPRDTAAARVIPKLIE